MLKIKIFLSVIIFSFFSIFTSFIKNETREIEKGIVNLSKIIHQKERDFNESHLDLSYLTSPMMLEKKIEYLDNSQYVPLEYSKIFLNISSFINIQNRFATQENKNEKKIQKK